MEYQGTIVSIGETVTVSEKFKKREVVLTDNAATYPQFIQFETHQDRCDLLDNVKVGEEVNVKFNMKGRQWLDPKTSQMKTFNTLQAWAITKLEGEKFKGETVVPTPDDDLPF